MLLRSSSTPILDSWIHQYSKESSSSSPEPEANFQRQRRRRSISLSNSTDDPSRKQKQPQRNIQKETSEPKPQKLNNPFDKNTRKQQETINPRYSSVSEVDRLFSSSGLGEKLVFDVNGGGSGLFDGSDSTNLYYQKMISADPGNSLLLGNYAKFLKEVRGEMEKAEEYCERAILANANDGNILSLYGDLIWQNHRNASRAESYFNQAVKSAPDDCYILASYAKFLWDSEEEDEDEDENDNREEQNEIELSPR